MKKLIFVIMLIFLASFVYAGLDEDLAACGNDIRCTYKVASRYDDVSACDSLDPSLVESCGATVEANNLVEEEVVVQEVIASYEDDSDKSEFPFSASVISVLLLFFVLFLLFEKHRHESFIADNQELISFIKQNFSLGVLKSEIKKELLKAGWKIHDIEKAFKHLKK